MKMHTCDVSGATFPTRDRTYDDGYLDGLKKARFLLEEFSVYEALEYLSSLIECVEKVAKNDN